MSDIVTPRDLPNELTEITNPETLIEIYNPDTARNEKIKKENFNIDGVRLNADRISSKEVVSGDLSVSGWYTIAETDISSGQTFNAYFAINWRKSSILIQAIITASTATKTHINSNIEILSKGFSATTNRIEGIRIAKSDTVDTAGFKLQIKINSSALTSSIGTQILGNINRVSAVGAGWFLVAPYLDDTPTLPDGVTVGTFLEAGEELTFVSGGTWAFSDVMGTKNSNDNIRVSVLWPEIPKQGTGITITIPTAAGLDFIDGAGNVGAVTVSFA